MSNFSSELEEFLVTELKNLPIAHHTDTYKRRQDQPLICAKCGSMAEAHYHLTNWGRWLDLCPADASEWLYRLEAAPFTG